MLILWSLDHYHQHRSRLILACIHLPLMGLFNFRSTAEFTVWKIFLLSFLPSLSPTWPDFGWWWPVIRQLYPFWVQSFIHSMGVWSFRLFVCEILQIHPNLCWHSFFFRLPTHFNARKRRFVAQKKISPLVWPWILFFFFAIISAWTLSIGHTHTHTNRKKFSLWSKYSNFFVFHSLEIYETFFVVKNDYHSVFFFLSF